MTRLDGFLKANGIRPTQVADDAGVSRQHLYRLRMGTVAPTRHVSLAIATACRRITGRPVSVPELFDVVKDVKVAAEVTIEQGRTFADSWIERASGSEAADEAFAAAGVMAWPHSPEAQARFNGILDEILARFWAEIREPAAKAFVEVANHVISTRRSIAP